SEAGAVDGHDLTGRDRADLIAGGVRDCADEEGRGRRRRDADRVVAGVGDVEIAGRVGGKAPRRVEARRSSGSAVARVTALAGPGDRQGRAVILDFHDTI